MNKKMLFGLIILVLALSLAGCSEPVPDNNTNKNQNQNQDQASNESIQAILAKASGVKNIEYEIEMILNGTPLPAQLKIYEKGEKYRMETSFMEQSQTGIYDGQHAYTYDSATDTYYLMEDDEQTGSKPIDFSDMSIQASNDASMKELGKEEVSGLKTRIIEFSYTAPEEEPTKTKAWISEKYGIPVKFEATTGTGENEMKSVMILKNIKIGTVKDSLFEVPQDKVKSYDEMWNTE